MNRMRVSLVEKHGEITGTVQSEGDALFVLECLSEVVQQIARRSGQEPAQVVRDLYALVMGRVG